MDDQARKFLELVESSRRILITSHISPDPDAVSSVLLMKMTLDKTYPDKHVQAMLEEEPIGLESVPGYDKITFKNIQRAVTELKPDLIIILDANNLSRLTRGETEPINSFIQENGVKTAIIDHHEPTGRDEADVYINQSSPAAAQDVYELCFNENELTKPEDYAQLTMLGLYSDSGGFAYSNPRHSDTFKLADELIGAGADIEKVVNLTHQYTKSDMQVFAELAGNISGEDDYSYSYISDEFVAQWAASGKSGSQMHKGTEGFVNNFLRNIEGRLWGFIAYKNILQGDNVYSASFRAVGDAKDVSKIAASLGGGGHKPAAGAKFEAASVEEALQIIKTVIDSAQ